MGKFKLHCAGDKKEFDMRKALVVWGGWEGHEPEKCANLLAGWLSEDGFDVQIENDAAAFGDASVHDLSLVVPVITQSKIEQEHAVNLCKAVENGVGLAGHHGGMVDAFRDVVEYQFMTGGQWVAHPGNIIDYTVDICDTDDEIVAGIKSFPYHSEQYYMHTDPSNEVLATTTFTGEHAYWTKGVIMPVVWKRMYGKGRVFHNALGHIASEFDVSEMATMMRRGMNWAAR